MEHEHEARAPPGGKRNPEHAAGLASPGRCVCAELKEFCSGFGVLWGISTMDTLCYGCVRVGATALGTLPCAAYTALYSLWMPLR